MSLQLHEVVLPLNARIIEEIVMPHVQNCSDCMRLSNSALFLIDSSKAQSHEMASTVCVHAILEVLEDSIGRVKTRAKVQRGEKK